MSTSINETALRAMVAVVQDRGNVSPTTAAQIVGQYLARTDTPSLASLKEYVKEHCSDGLPGSAYRGKDPTAATAIGRMSKRRGGRS